MSDVSELLNAIARDHPHAARDLLPLVYDELRRLAAARLSQEQPGHTLQPTALVHEAYLRLVGSADPGWDGRGHFFSAAAEAMRRILVDQARRRVAKKRNAPGHRVNLDGLIAIAEKPEELLALDEALDELQRHDPQAAKLVNLRYFSGLTHQEAADALGITRRVADRIWVVARAWLYQRMHSS